MAGELIRRLTGADRDLIRGFNCVWFPRRWEELLPELVEMVADGLAEGDGISALGAFVGEELVGVAGWRADPDEASTWTVPLVAVRLGHQRKGLGKVLKLAVLDEARSAGIEYVVSRVHSENEPMLNINSALGAELIREPATDWYGFYYSCLIAIPRTP